MAANTNLEEHSVDDFASLLDEKLSNQGYIYINYILTIIAILMGINCEAIKNKLKRTITKIIELRCMVIF